VGVWARRAVTALFGSGLGRPLLALCSAAGGRCFQVLTYHRINDDGHPLFPAVPVQRFARQMEFVAAHFRVLPLAELVEGAAAGTLPVGALGISFDDGYRDNYAHAFPVLVRLRLPATVFLVSGSIESGSPPWHDHVFDAFLRTRAERFVTAGRSFPLDSLAGRRRALETVLPGLKRRAPSERLEAVGRLRRELGVDGPPGQAYDMLSWDQVREMAAGGIDVGAHTVSHSILTTLAPAEFDSEVADCKTTIEQRLGRCVPLFAYPNGGPGDFDEGAKAALRRIGFRAAFTALQGTNRGGDPLELRRVGLWDDDPRVDGLRLALERLTRPRAQRPRG